MFPTKILLATNGTFEAALAEEAAVELANGTGSELHIVNVVHTTPELPYPRNAMRERSEALLELKKLGGLRILDGCVRRLEEAGVSVTESHYREGWPQNEVIRLAEEIDAGLVITGGRRRPWLERFFCGAGFSEDVLRRADRSVLVVSERRLQGSTVPR